MGDLLIRGIPDTLKRDIEVAAHKRGQSLSSTAIELLRKGMVQDGHLPKQSAWDVLRATFEADGPVDGEFAKILEDIEAERKKDFGREPNDFT